MDELLTARASARSSDAAVAVAPLPVAHPFAAHWTSIFPVACALVRCLHGVWHPATMLHLLAPPPFTASAQLSPAGAPLPASRAVTRAAARFILAASREELLVLLRTGRSTAGGGASGSPSSAFGEDSDTEEEGGEAHGADADGRRGVVTMPEGDVLHAVDLLVAHGGATEGALSTQTMLLPPETSAVCQQLSTWYSRILWHTYAVLTWAAKGHVSSATPLTRATWMEPLTDASPASQLAPAGLFGHGLQTNGSWEQLCGVMHVSTLAHCPLRVLRMTVQQILPALVDAVPDNPPCLARVAHVINHAVAAVLFVFRARTSATA
ncbi:MAG: hypothetical protein EOO41_05705, partial [Methanobacteriota archaeon]